MTNLTATVIDIIESIGEVGVGLLIALETILPPIPSEVILPFAGFAAQEGKLNPFLAWGCATLGSLAGAMVLYLLGVRFSYDRLHHLAERKWFFLFGVRDLERGMRFFKNHGGVVVLVGRFIPFIRSVVSVPAGLDAMPLPRFLALTALGSGIWNAVFIAIGYRLGAEYEVVERYVGPVSKGVVAVLALALVWLVVRRLRERRLDEAGGDADSGADSNTADDARVTTSTDAAER